MQSIRLGKTKSGPQLSNGWITGRNFSTNEFRLEKAVGDTRATEILNALSQDRVRRLIIVVDQTGKTWTYEADSDGKPFKLLK